jgi:hypothetical protein
MINMYCGDIYELPACREEKEDTLTDDYSATHLSIL